MLWPDCAYAQAGLSLCWSHIPHCLKSHSKAPLPFGQSWLWPSLWQYFARMLLIIQDFYKKMNINLSQHFEYFFLNWSQISYGRSLLILYVIYSHAILLNASNAAVYTPVRRQSKRLILSTNVDQKSLETVFWLPFVARFATSGNLKARFLIRARRLLRAFSIVAFPVWYR